MALRAPARATSPAPVRPPAKASRPAPLAELPPEVATFATRWTAGDLDAIYADGHPTLRTALSRRSLGRMHAYTAQAVGRCRPELRDVGFDDGRWRFALPCDQGTLTFGIALADDLGTPAVTGVRVAASAGAEMTPRARYPAAASAVEMLAAGQLERARELFTPALDQRTVDGRALLGFADRFGPVGDLGVLEQSRCGDAWCLVLRIRSRTGTGAARAAIRLDPTLGRWLVDDFTLTID